METLGKKSAIVTSISNNQWLPAEVMRIVEETPNVKTYSFKLPHAANHVAGQHYELQLTAANGYQAARPYSAASTARNMPLLDLTIQHVPDGEVSSYIYDSLKVGDKVEIRGPFGKFFVWEPEVAEPILLIAGGSGVVPMHSMLQSHTSSQSPIKMHLLYSARTYENIIYKNELLNSPNTTITLTQNDTEDWQGHTGRIDTALLKATLNSFETSPLCFICGMSSFVGSVSDALQSLGIPTDKIKTERFG